MPRPAKRARVEEAPVPAAPMYEHQEQEDNHDEDIEDEEEDYDIENDEDDDMEEDDPDADGDADADGDREAQALVHALAGSKQGADPQQKQQQQQHEHIVDYCYRMGYFPAKEPFPNAVTANRFRAAPLRPQRTLEKNPLTRRSWHPKKPANWCAVLLQCGGQEVSDACTRCVDGQGFWTQCVVPNDWATSWITRGACANCYMDGKRAMCSRGFGMAVSPSARAKAAAAQPAATSSPEASNNTAVANSSAPQFTNAGFAPPAVAAPVPRRRGRPSGAATAANAAQTPSNNLNNQDFESLKRQYNRMSTSELDKFAEQASAERARISLQLAAIDAVRAAREAFANQQHQQTNGTRST
ncbi:hypothetical protein GE09DRAFT_1217143 [Coniochaeta sp. 2T2.1]|nr:hypothetical protein GE09DRAFT_1217143 [Coniochaeta sp. 2T2.1]